MDRSPAQHCGWVRDSPVAVIHRACVMRRDFVTAPGPGWKSAYFRLINDKASKEHDIFAVLLTSCAQAPHRVPGRRLRKRAFVCLQRATGRARRRKTPVGGQDKNAMLKPGLPARLAVWYSVNALSLWQWPRAGI